MYGIAWHMYIVYYRAVANLLSHSSYSLFTSKTFDLLTRRASFQDCGNIFIVLYQFNKDFLQLAIYATLMDQQLIIPRKECLIQIAHIKCSSQIVPQRSTIAIIVLMSYCIFTYENVQLYAYNYKLLDDRKCMIIMPLVQRYTFAYLLSHAVLRSRRKIVRSIFQDASICKRDTFSLRHVYYSNDSVREKYVLILIILGVVQYITNGVVRYIRSAI
eukprot:TRINITY_DN25619_c0_g2_i6.p2 TRINITY_DN25619_c0_g2~~TRINITY_DN25619_c0_g2_i6.p2  ORF type:complete len:216 (-),score=-15.19 TRINITY_DN25619_c0_g2_i6:932-1579(-)